MLLNVATGDSGRIQERPCGCLFGRVGLTTHLSHIRSHEKLTGEGVTFAGFDLARIVEEVLPARFGGNFSDYQIVEEESREGLPHVYLTVSPSVGEIDEGEAVRVFLEEIGKEAEAQKIMARVYAQVSCVQVRRAQPRMTRAGKLFPFRRG